MDGDIQISPIDWFIPYEDSLSAPIEASEWVDISSPGYFVDSAAMKSCIGRWFMATGYGYAHKGLNKFSPYYPLVMEHGASIDLGFSVMIWIKFGDVEPIAVPISVGCPSKIMKSYDVGGMIGKDILSYMGATIMPSNKDTNGSLTFYQRKNSKTIFLSKGTSQSVDDVDLKQNPKYFYRPRATPTLEINHVWRVGDSTGLHFDDAFWKHGINFYHYCIHSTNEFERAVVAVVGAHNISITNAPLPDSPKGCLDSQEVVAIAAKYLFESKSILEPHAIVTASGLVTTSNAHASWVHLQIEQEYERLKQKELQIENKNENMATHR